MTIAFKENPFYVLQCSMTHDKSHIHKQAIKRSFEINENLCLQAERALITPNRRLAAEVAWFPNFNKKLLRDRFKQIQAGPQQYLKDLDSHKTKHSLDEANLVCYILESAKDPDSNWQNNEIVLAVATLCTLSEEIKPTKKLKHTIEKKRQIADMPSNIDAQEFSTAISDRKIHYNELLYSFLDQIESGRLVTILTTLIAKHTDMGRKPCDWSLLEEILNDYYTPDALIFLEKQEEKLIDYIHTVKTDWFPSIKRKEAIDKSFVELNKILTLWGTVAKPLQIWKKSCGLEDEYSEQLYYGRILDLANYLHMRYLSRFALKVLELSEKFFSEVKGMPKEIEEHKEILRKDIHN